MVFYKGQTAWNKGKCGDEYISEETKERMSVAQRNRFRDPLERRKHSDSIKGNKCHLGCKHSEETKKMISTKQIGRKQSKETVEKRVSHFRGENHWLYGKHHTEESNEKNREKHLGEKASNWKGGVSFDPYCDKFTEDKREEVREKYDRKCLICNTSEKDNLTKTNKIRKLSVHHIDGDKEQGCNDKPWFLVPLCMKCHARTTNKKNSNYWIKYIQNILKYYEFYNISMYMCDIHPTRSIC